MPNYYILISIIQHRNIYIIFVPNRIRMNMVYIRSKKIKGKTYYYIVEGKLDKRGKVKQKVLMYLGNIDNILKVFTFYKEQN